MTPLSPHFSLEELTASPTARALEIDNTPTEMVLDNLKRLTIVLELAREVLGCGLLISSGYRCPKLNAAVGGAKTSAHLDGRAADFHPAKGLLDGAFNLLKASPIPYDQLIIEHSRTAAWIHLGIARTSEMPRRQAMSATGTPGAMTYRTAEG